MVLRARTGVRARARFVQFKLTYRLGYFNEYRNNVDYEHEHVQGLGPKNPLDFASMLN